LTSSNSFNSPKYPPGPSSVVNEKILIEFMHDPIKFLIKISKEYGDIIHFMLGKQHVYLLNNPDYIEDVLIKNYKYFIKSKGLQVSKRLLGEGLVTSEGEYHDRQRKLIQPAFHPNRIKTYADIMTSFTLNMSKEWKDGIELDIHKEMTHITSNIISKSVLGSDIEDNEGDDIGKCLLKCMEYFNRVQMPFGDLIEKVQILPINKGFQQSKKKLDLIVNNMINEHREKERNNNDMPESDLLYTLLKVQDLDSGIEKMTDSQLHDEIMTIFLAGHETTSNALTWTFYLLSQHPAIASRLYEEISTVLTKIDENSKQIFATVEDIPKLEYTEKVLREAMRLYPPAWTIGRQAIHDYKIGNYIIESGSVILMSQYIMHHDSRYFPEPYLFYPDRWSKITKSHLPRFSYFPFGGGIRGCIGESFAWLEGILVIATIFRNWKMHHNPNHKVELQPLITLRPKYGMMMRLEKRI
jgi:cytochrome P450